MNHRFDFLWCAPQDPFLLKETPHVYFAGNQPAFDDKLVEADGVKARLI